ncbi:MAG: hypothetical protein QOD41_1575 [Cryptosporangiaceae bacterium]|nr:hypothetical protein [Cryptosporangiaceae bacterium]
MVAALPYLLGFHPEESIVLVGLRGHSEVVVTIRGDLPDPAAEPVGGRAMAAHLARSAVTDGVTHAVVIVVTRAGDPGSLPRRRLAEHTARALRGHGLTVLDQLCVRDGRYWSYTCADRGCCPPEGTVPPPVGGGSVAVGTVAAGRVVLPGRPALVATLEPARADPDLERAFGGAGSAQDALARRRGLAVAAAEGVTAIAAEVVRRADGGGVLTAGAVASHAVALALPAVRDGCLRWIGGPLSGAAESLWLELARRALPAYVAPAATILGMYAYARGDGAFARVCTDRALKCDPAYALAELLNDALDYGISPPDIVRMANSVVAALAGDGPAGGEPGCQPASGGDG